ncbi:hypothetical protein Pcinc_042956 [Petrolisthes cinctipes]|uniref:RING-type domain-containing protein n=1 Tax=Petrolisthes cinctipes TaxID=88211 RepID=A0AAE1BHN4_PETCI|nr:hypothetical protein Pcinc_042956 [Petrolisthes cinctipes]
MSQIIARRGRKPRPGESWCPVCGVTLRAGELEPHLSHELDKLARLPQTRPLGQRTPTPTTANPTSTTPTPTTSVVATVSSPLSPHLPLHARARDPGWDSPINFSLTPQSPINFSLTPQSPINFSLTPQCPNNSSLTILCSTSSSLTPITYQRVRANRQVRLRAKKRRAGGGRCDETNGPACPVCGDRVPVSTPEDLHAHVESCLRRKVLVPLLTYRACPVPQSGGVVQGGGGGTEEEVVDVEGDVEEYEWCGGRRVRVPSLIRPPSQLLERHRDGDRNDDTEMTPSGGSGGASEGGEGGGNSRVEPMSVELEALKEKVRVLEREGAGASSSSKFLCIVCQTEYERPAVSVVCWHVLCEACWGHTLGVKGECPQCSHSVSPEDLRPIHL